MKRSLKNIEVGSIWRSKQFPSVCLKVIGLLKFKKVWLVKTIYMYPEYTYPESINNIDVLTFRKQFEHYLSTNEVAIKDIIE